MRMTKAMPAMIELFIYHSSFTLILLIFITHAKYFEVRSLLMPGELNINNESFYLQSMPLIIGIHHYFSSETAHIAACILQIRNTAAVSGGHFCQYEALRRDINFLWRWRIERRWRHAKARWRRYWRRFRCLWRMKITYRSRLICRHDAL